MWIGDAVSTAGSVISGLAIPLTAALFLNASPFEMGLLAAMGQAPRLVLSLYLGVLVGTRPKLPLMRWCQLLRAISLLSIPLAFSVELLSIAQLYTVALLNGATGLAFTYADRSLLPKLVDGRDLLAANARLRVTSTIAGTAGPSLAGVIMQVIAAPLLILFDALSYLMSWALLRSIKIEEAPATKLDRTAITDTLKRGARFVMNEPTLRALTLSSFFATAGASMFAALLILYLVGPLALPPTWVGIIMSGTGAAAVLSALMAERVSNWLGKTRAIILSTAIPVLGYVLISSAGAGLEFAPFVVPLIVLSGRALIGLATPLYQINEVTLRQTLTDDALLPTVTSFRTFLAGSAGPIFALLGGVLGEMIGLRPTLYVATGLFALGLLPLMFLGRGQ